MKYFNYQITVFICGLFLASCSTVTGEDNPYEIPEKVDDSSLTQEQKELTRHNAVYLAFRDQFKKDSTFIDISEEIVDFYYNTLALILTSEAGKESEIVQNMGIFGRISLNEIIAHPLKSAPFHKSWADSTIETGIKELDSILKNKGFEISEIYNWSFSNNEPTYILKTTTPVNTLQISALLEQSGNFAYAETNGSFGDGSDINVEFTSTGYLVSFIDAYGDCPSGCISHDTYQFSVTENGEVKFIGKE